MGPLTRVYKLGLVSGVVYSLPLLVVSGWYLWSAYAGLDRYRQALGDPTPIDAELLQIALHDELMRDLGRLRAANDGGPSQLPTIALSLSRANLDALLARPSGEGEDAYVDGLLEKDGKVHEVKVRLRGDQPWHRLGPQKSMKVRMKRGDLLDGVRVFNLLNDPTPFGLEDQLILALAREADLLTPAYRPVRVRLNNHDLGVFRFESQPDESVPRLAGRIPGNMYSGDADELDPPPPGGVFGSPGSWRKIASRTEAEEHDRREIDELLRAVGSFGPRAFAEYARDALDLERYAAFDALDVTFGGNEHDHLSNHKFYADPYRGRLEPVVFSFRGFRHEEALNLSEHPLLLRLALTPGYLARRNRAVYALLTGPASLPSIRARATDAGRALAADLSTDPYWDAYKLLPRATRLHRFLTRPMTLDRWARVAEYELAGYADRTRYLLDQLEAPGLELGAGEPSSTGTRTTLRVDLFASGTSAHAVTQIRFPPGCNSPAVHADADLDGVLGPGDPRVDRPGDASWVALRSHRQLEPRVALVARPDPSPRRGKVSSRPERTRFSYFLSAAGCDLRASAFDLEDLVTGASQLLGLAAVPTHPVAEREPFVDPEVAEPIAPGVRGVHPWSLPTEPERPDVVLGPGELTLTSSRSFAASERVTIAPGTTLRLGPRVSLLFAGRLEVLADEARPVRLERADPAHPFGGLALQGPGTAGSRLRHVEVVGGSRPRGGRIDYPGTLNVHDTRDIELVGLSIAETTGADDAIHAYSVDGLTIHELRVRRVPVDAVDLEFVTGRLRGLDVAAVGDDCLDLMGSRLSLQDSVLSGCTNNGVSAGELTVLSAHGLVVTQVGTGVLAKNASEVRLLRSLVAGAPRGLEAKSNEVRYAGRSRIGLADVWLFDCEDLQKADEDSAIELGGIREGLPGPAERARSFPPLPAHLAEDE